MLGGIFGDCCVFAGEVALLPGRFARPTAGEVSSDMAQVTEADEEFARRVTVRLRAETGDEAASFTGSQAQARREYGLTTPGGEGGKHRPTPYSGLDVEVVAAVEAAKLEPEYRGKLHRAVLIAFARETPVPDGGLQRAYREHYRAERKRLQGRLSGARQPRDDGLAAYSRDDRRAFQRVETAMLLGTGVDSNDLVRFLSAFLPTAREGLATIAEIARAEVGDDGLNAMLRQPPARLVDEGAGLLDLSGRVGPSPLLLPAAGRMVDPDNTSMVLWEKLVRTAPRIELDAARELLLLLRANLKQFGELSDFDVAALVPTCAQMARVLDGKPLSVDEDP
jgi:hypothetical protein